MPTDEQIDQQIRDILDELDRRERQVSFLDAVLTVLYPACIGFNVVAAVARFAEGEHLMAFIFGVITILWIYLTVNFFKSKKANR